jgi:hypothetical protein
MIFLLALKVTDLLLTGVILPEARTSHYDLNYLTNITSELK